MDDRRQKSQDLDRDSVSALPSLPHHTAVLAAALYGPSVPKGSLKEFPRVGAVGQSSFWFGSEIHQKVRLLLNLKVCGTGLDPR